MPRGNLVDARRRDAQCLGERVARQTLPAGTFVSLPFLYFERGSEVIAGMFDVEVTAPRLRLLARPPFEAAPEKAHRFRARVAATAATDTIAPMASLDTAAAIARPYIPMVLGMLRKWLAGRR
ncbi:MAG: hypothetical protein ABWX83_13465 [Luteibacter sp.]